MKSEETLKLEHALIRKTVEFRTFGCPEVTIGWYGKKRVDFMQTNTKGTIWCYEIKVSEGDFHSKHGHNFEGHYNYYVMPRALYQAVKDEIPDEIGVLVGTDLECVKKAKRKSMSKSRENDMKMYLIRSLSRELKKSWNSKDKVFLAGLMREISHLKKRRRK